MPDPIVPTGDADFDAALATASGVPPTPEPVAAEAPVTPPETVAEPVAEEAPASDFTFETLANGDREMRLATGQVYRGKTDQDVMNAMAKAQAEASRTITQLNGRVKEMAPPPVAPPAVEQPIDATALAIADLMAPAFGVKNGAELVAKFAEQQQTAVAQQEFMEAQRANYEAANFFRAVPEFSKSQGDADKIDQFLQTNNLPFNAATAEMAFHTLKAKGEFKASAPATPAAPKNGMPAPPVGSSPAATGKGTTTEADLWAMTSEQLADLLASGSTQ